VNAIYNEIDPFACNWLERLVDAGHIGPGRVERRSITELTAADVAGPGQRHFFAGIGVWSYALRLAGVPDDASIWTGSCPCQPFSSAGSRGGTSDPRHLWPAWFALIEQCRPAVIFGEQVASKDGLAWLDLVFADLERCGYTVGAADLCAAGVGAPHIRQRLYFVAYADDSNKRVIRVGNAAGPRHNRTEVGREDRRAARGGIRRVKPERASETRRLGHAGCDGDLEHDGELRRDEAEREERAAHGDHAPIAAGATRGFWADADWIPCTDGVARPVEPGTFPLAHGAPARVGRLRGYGNAIVAEVAATFIEAALEAIGEQQ
jgi:DNA (cytosine-5)-methyltransferase 1